MLAEENSSRQIQFYNDKLVEQPVKVVCLKQLDSLRDDLQTIQKEFLQFRDQVMVALQSATDKMRQVLQKQLKEQKKLQYELNKQKDCQQLMKTQVNHLKEWINDAVKDYSIQISLKNKEIATLKEILGQNQSAVNVGLVCLEEENGQKELEVIEEEHSYIANSSSTTSARITVQEEIKIAGQKKTKSFLDHFRKTIEESFNQKEEQSIVPAMTKLAQDSMLKEECIIANKECIIANKLSNSSSGCSLLAFEETDKINIPMKLQSPKNMAFLKTKDKSRPKMQTEPSPERLDEFTKENIQMYFSGKDTGQSQERQKRLSNGKRDSMNSSGKSSVQKVTKGSKSKEKIKVTSKISDSSLFNSRQIKAKPLVHLGGKTTLKKFISDVKVALQHYQLWPSRRGDELKYEGEMRNNLRQGKGRIYYKNGVVYVGNFHENTRHGHGILELNGVNIFEGEWFSDAIQGEGYIKSMKLMSTNCPILLHSSSYCGSLFNNALHGMGTLFLTSKQKIVTRFHHGTPVGELTYYSQHQIEFGVWPQQ